MLKKEWRHDAERRARLQLTLLNIAREEKISAEEKNIDAEVKHLLEHHKDADKESARSFVETLLTNQKVIEFLENREYMA